jgi:hypothetical protein
MRADEVLIFTRGQPAIRAQQLQYHRQPFFRNRAALKPPQVSDRITTAPPAGDKALRANEAALPRSTVSAANGSAGGAEPRPDANGQSDAAHEQFGFLKYAAAAKDPAGANDGGGRE